MGEYDPELRNVPDEPPEAEADLLQESVVGDVAASVAAVANVGMLGYAAASFHRRWHDAAAEARHEAEIAALPAEMDAEMRVMRAQGLGFGVDDYCPGFGVDDDYYGGFE
jgi:hypothetical protein